MTDAVLASAKTQVFAASLPLTHRDLLRLGALLFLAPNAMFATTFAWPAGIAVWLGCAIALWIIWTLPAGAFLARRIDAAGFTLSLAVGSALCAIGGEAHFFYTQPDWLWRDAVLADLVKNGFSVLYAHDGQSYLLRAPLGMYLMPALIGRGFGLYAAHLTMLAQNAFLVGAMLYIASAVAGLRRAPFLLLIVCFSGADIIPVLVIEAKEAMRLGEIPPFGPMEWWTNYWAASPIQYSSVFTQIAWAPNHLLPGWWFAILALLFVRSELDLAMLGVNFAALLVWSPLAMMSALAIIALFAFELGLRRLLTPRLFIAALGALAFAPLAYYLGLDAGEVPHSFVLATPGFIAIYLAFLAVELPHAGVVAYAWRIVEPVDRRLVALAIVLLIVIPLYGVGEFNDTVMRASIAPLFLLSFTFARIAMLTPRDGSRFSTTISVIVLISLATPIVVVKEALEKPYAISNCSLVTAWRKTRPQTLPMNYWAHTEAAPSWLIHTEGPALTVEDRQCWPDHPQLLDRMK